jgi:hypothetical protein
MCTSAFFDCRGAARTRQFLATKDPSKIKVITPLASCVDVIFVSRAALLYRQRQYILDFREEPSEFGGRNIFYKCGWMDLGSPQTFIGVDIAYADNDSLVEQGSFDAGIFAALNTLYKLCGRKVSRSRLRSDFFEEIQVIDLNGRYEPHPTKLTLIVEEQFGVFKLNNNAGRAVRQATDKRIIRVAGTKALKVVIAAVNHLAGHFEMYHDRVLSVQVDE